jgi:hypothetical protein
MQYLENLFGVGRNYGVIKKMVMDIENNDVGRPPYIKKTKMQN